MQRRILKRLTLITAAAVLLGACEGQMGTKDDEGMEADVVEGSMDTAADEATTQGMADEGVFQGHPLDDPSSPLSQRTIYFAFDSSHIEEENRSIIEAHAEWLARHPGANVTLEGHADERGTREYNVALGRTARQFGPPAPGPDRSIGRADQDHQLRRGASRGRGA